MSAFITIATYPNISELAIAKGRLEADGIACFVQDELTVQVYNFYEQAVGGVKLQVNEDDVETARRILIESGLLADLPPDDYEVRLVGNIDRWSSKIPVLGRFNIFKRFAYLLLLLAFLVVAITFATLYKSDFDLINNKVWCLYQVEHKNKVLVPNTIEKFKLIIYGECPEKAKFYKNGTMVFPGFNSKSIHGTWKLVDDEMFISGVDTLGEMLDGTYDVDVSRTELILSNSNTVITLYK